eukprot:9783660-Alexandrium_andersonii.AAC.1
MKSATQLFPSKTVARSLLASGCVVFQVAPSGPGLPRWFQVAHASLQIGNWSFTFLELLDDADSDRRRLALP